MTRPGFGPDFIPGSGPGSGPAPLPHRTGIAKPGMGRDGLHCAVAGNGTMAGPGLSTGPVPPLSHSLSHSPSHSGFSQASSPIQNARSKKRRHMRGNPLRHAIGGLALAALSTLGGCSLPGAGVSVEGDMKLLYAPFSLRELPQFWYYAERPALPETPPANSGPEGGGDGVDGNPHTNETGDAGDGANMRNIPRPALSWQDVDGRIALATRPGREDFELGRRTNIPVLASPFLSYDWHMNANARPGDSELVLGFREQGGDGWRESDLGLGKPSADHFIRLPIAATSPAAGWQREYFDLATLHRQYWPDTDETRLRLVWVAIAASPERTPDVDGVTYISHILLSR